MTEAIKPAPQSSRPIARPSGAAPFSLPATGLLISILLVGAFLRFHNLGAKSLWLDEAYTWDMVIGHDWRGIWGAMLFWSNVSPLPYVLLKLGLPLFGISEFGLRLLSAFAGWLAIPVTYRLGRALFSMQAGWLAAAIMALSPFAVWYSQEARAYGLYLFLSALVLWTFVRAERGRGWLAYIVACALGYLTHYVVAVYAYAQAAYCLTQLRRRPRLFRRWMLAQAVAIVPVGLWVLAFLLQRRGVAGMSWIPGVTLLTPLQTLWNYFSGDGDHFTWSAIAGLALIIGLIVWAIRSKPAAAPLLLWWLVAPLALTWLFSLRKASYVDRYFEPGLLAAALLVAGGLAALPRWGRAVATAGMLAGLLWGSARLYTDPLFAKEDWRTAAQVIDVRGWPVAVADPETPLALTPYVASNTKFVLTETESDISHWWAQGPLVLAIRSPHESGHALTKSEPFDLLSQGPAFFRQWRAAHPDVPLQILPYTGLTLVVVGAH
jgi:4-amino-4-deoxy-L-arabinose transferase-like glycosyltransferase